MISNFKICLVSLIASLFIIMQQDGLCVLAKKKNTYPIVLVHGFAGWGPDEMFGFPYFGGWRENIKVKLEQNGHRVITAAVGPFSSNWDRACELYAQIKGGTVDYGKRHSTVHKHLRYGRTYKGMYQEWGDIDGNGDIKKLHFIGHSMGGQTVRMLIQLLSQGTKGAPIQEDAEEEGTSLLFKGGHESWVHSITTISSPHMGTMSAHVMKKLGGTFGKRLFGIGAAIIGLLGDMTKVVYDLKVDQWGIEPRRKDEKLFDYIKRVFKSDIFKHGYKDVCLHDMLEDGGAKEINNWVRTQPSIFYYSFSTESTYASKVPIIVGKPIQLPYLTMLPPFWPLATMIGSTFVTKDEGYPMEWQQNDGVVNTISMRGNPKDPIIEYNSTIKHYKTGTWYHLHIFERLDHLGICSWNPFGGKMSDYYINHATFLSSLPNHKDLHIVVNGTRRLREEGHMINTDILNDLQSSIKRINVENSKEWSKDEMIQVCDKNDDKVNPIMKRYCDMIRNERFFQEEYN